MPEQKEIRKTEACSTKCSALTTGGFNEWKLPDWVLASPPDRMPNDPQAPCAECGGIVFAVPVYDLRPIEQAEQRCLECHGPMRPELIRRLTMLFEFNFQQLVAIEVDWRLRPVFGTAPPANLGTGGQAAATGATTAPGAPDEEMTADQAALDLRPWKTWSLPDGTTIHSRVWHQRGQLGGRGRPPEIQESLDEWFDRLPRSITEIEGFGNASALSKGR